MSGQPLSPEDLAAMHRLADKIDALELRMIEDQVEAEKRHQALRAYIRDGK